MDYYKPYSYGLPVRISNWQDQMLVYPIDNPNPKKCVTSHYKTFGVPGPYVIPKTTAQEQQESGLLNKCMKHKFMPIVNFSSYPMKDFRFDNHGPQDVTHTYKYVTSYERDYKAPKPLIKKADCCEKELDPLLNKIPMNAFEMLPSSTNKFMDDHLVNPSEDRKKINFLRQLRASTNIFQIKKKKI